MAQPSTNHAPVSCAYCEGKGDTGSGPCRACDGQGNVLVAQPARKCAQCEGKGRKSAYRCNSCRGTGWGHVLRRPAP